MIYELFNQNSKYYRQMMDVIVAASNINVQLMFAGCTRMSGDWDAWVSAFSAKSPASYKNRVFSGCTGIDNYATYTANSALSSIFLS